MVCPTPRSGRYGFVGDYTGSVLTRYSRIRNWNLNPLANPEVRYYSGTRFGAQRIPGFLTYSGSFSGFGGVPPLFAGDTFTFIGYTAPTDGVACDPGCAYYLPAIVDSLAITWNWTAENKTVNWTINYSSIGAMTEDTTFDPPCDDEVFCDPNPCDLNFVMKDPCDSDNTVEWCNLVSATLTFTANNVSYSNNSTSCTLVKSIGNLDWTLEVVDQNPCIIPTLQADYWFTIDATTTPTTWILKWGQFTSVSDFNINIETGEIISKTNTFSMQAVNCCTPASPERGSIIDPAGTTVWPYTTAS